MEVSSLDASISSRTISVHQTIKTSSMTRIIESTIIPAPIEEVFRYASDYKLWEKWYEGVSGFHPTTETTRGNGTRYAYKAKMMGLSLSVESEIHDFVENKGWIGKSTKGTPFKTFWKFESEKNGTKLTHALEYEFNIPLIGKWLDSKFMKPQSEKTIINSLENLKKHFMA